MKNVRTELMSSLYNRIKILDRYGRDTLYEINKGAWVYRKYLSDQFKAVDIYSWPIKNCIIDGLP